MITCNSIISLVIAGFCGVLGFIQCWIIASSTRITTQETIDTVPYISIVCIFLFCIYWSLIYKVQDACHICVGFFRLGSGNFISLVAAGGAADCLVVDVSLASFNLPLIIALPTPIESIN